MSDAPCPPAPFWRARAPHALAVDGHAFPVDLARHPRARRYVLRVTAAGRLRLTIPRGASIAAGLSFAGRQQAWIAREWQRLQGRSAPWENGTLVWFRGERVRLQVEGEAVTLAGIRVDSGAAITIRTAVESHLRTLAASELPGRLNDLAAARALPSAVVTVRNQRSRWGSCSPRGAIALNWRLIQMPPEVTDYVILHELAHRLHANHSRRFWRAVEAVCPWWRGAERWLRTYGKELF